MILAGFVVLNEKGEHKQMYIIIMQDVSVFPSAAGSTIPAGGKRVDSEGRYKVDSRDAHLRLTQDGWLGERVTRQE